MEDDHLTGAEQPGGEEEGGQALSEAHQLFDTFSIIRALEPYDKEAARVTSAHCCRLIGLAVVIALCQLAVQPHLRGSTTHASVVGSHAWEQSAFVSGLVASFKAMSGLLQDKKGGKELSFFNELRSAVRKVLSAKDPVLPARLVLGPTVVPRSPRTTLRDERGQQGATMDHADVRSCATARRSIARNAVRSDGRS